MNGPSAEPPRPQRAAAGEELAQWSGQAAAHLLQAQAPRGALLGASGRCAVAEAALAAHALDLLGEGERARRFHRWLVAAVRAAGDLSPACFDAAGQVLAADAARPAEAGETAGRRAQPASAAASAAAAAAAAAWGTWLWSLSDHLLRHRAPAMPRAAAQAAQRAASYILRFLERQLAPAHAGAAGEAGAPAAGGTRRLSPGQLAAVQGGLQALSTWLRIPDLTRHLAPLWDCVSEELARPQPAGPQLALLALPFDVVDPSYPPLLAALRRLPEQDPAWQPVDWLCLALHHARRANAVRLGKALDRACRQPAQPPGLLEHALVVMVGAEWAASRSRIEARLTSGGGR